jgi:hypothetical protein
LDLTTTVRTPKRAMTVLLVSFFITGCGAQQVIVNSQFPQPVVDPLPLTVGVHFSDEFKSHTFVDDPESKTERSWIVETGLAQVNLWQTVLGSLFEGIVYLDAPPSPEAPASQVDGVITPVIADLQYAIPTQTNTSIYEIWLRYDINLSTAQGESVAQWSMTGYGKTPEAFMLGAQDAVEAAAIVALRDAGANFIVNFGQQPEVKGFLEQHVKAVHSESTRDEN